MKRTAVRCRERSLSSIRTDCRKTGQEEQSIGIRNMNVWKKVRKHGDGATWKHSVNCPSRAVTALSTTGKPVPPS